MKKNIFKNKFFIIVSFISLSFGVYLLIEHLKQKEIENYKKDTYRDKVIESKVYLNTLIKEKLNATSTIGLGLSRNSDIIDALKQRTINKNILKNYSKRISQNTDFKNVWFQLVTKEGIAIQRSWTDESQDKIVDLRTDLQLALKEEKISNTISVGKFDMTFKATVPVFDYDDVTFLGMVEVITHFNSIALKLEEKKIDTIILADKKYKKQLTKAISNTFIEDYYVANFDAKKHITNHLQNQGVENYLEKVHNEDFYIDYQLNSIVSYYKLNDVINNSILGHIFLIQSIDKIDLSKMTDIEYIHNLYLLFSLIILILVFYFLSTYEVMTLDSNTFSLKIFAIIFIVYLILSFVIYKLILMKYEGDIENYERTIINQTLLEYNSIVKKNQDISEFIFLEMINNKETKDLFKNRQRKELYNTLLERYKELTLKYNLRQLHFHLPDSSSFLRMHRPEKYGDSLKDIRPGIVYVNENLMPFYGFEEGRIFNGFRYVFPMMEKNQHLGSVEISFDVKSFVDNYMKMFETKRVNFLISKKVVQENVFTNEQSNYIQSPIEGFYFDKLILEKIETTNSKIFPLKANENIFNEMTKKIYEGVPFAIHFDQINELAIVIPILNKITGEVVGSLNVSKSDRFIKNRLLEFTQLIVVVLIVLGFIMFFIYREFLSKVKAQIESRNNQKILDSQNSFIIITNGLEIKKVNNTFLDFFGYENLESFKEEYDCICDFFVQEVGKNYLTKTVDGKNWFDYLYENYQNNLQVKIYDSDKQTHIFYIEFDPDNQIDGKNYIVTFIDITHLKNIESQLLNSEKMASLGIMIGNIAHQWRQPLSIISTCASGINMKHKYGLLQEGDIEKNMEYIVENTQYLSDTIDTFRDFIKDSDSKEHLQTDINQSIESVLKIVDASLKNNYIEVEFKKYEKEPLIKDMVKGEFVQVITNIINNAKDILKERGVKNPKIRIVSKKVFDHVEVTIEDNAGGIPENIIDKIFEPYFTTKHQSMGTGLGLYICHKIVLESLNGDLRVKNTKHGAKFTVAFPL